MSDVVVPLALYDYGSVDSLLKLPYRILTMLVNSTKQEDIKKLIERKINGKDAQ